MTRHPTIQSVSEALGVRCLPVRPHATMAPKKEQLVIVIEISQNPNCEAVEMRVFHDLEPPRRVSRVRLERAGGESRWWDVTGWTVSGAAAPALAQKVDDSGDGVAFLIYGSDAGLRLRPAGSGTPWQLGHPEQWGLPFLLTTEISLCEIST